MSYKQFAITVTYQDVVKLVYKTSHRMSSIYFVPFEEVLGQAHILFMEAYLSYNPNSGARFTTYLQNILYWRLTDWCKNEYRERLHVEINPEVVGTYSHNHSWLHDLMASLSDEAKVIVQSVMGSSKELHTMMLRHHRDDGEWFMAEGKKEIKATLVKYLRKLGWLPDEVGRGFKEITHILATGIPDDPKPVRKERAHRKCKLHKGQVYLLTRRNRPQH